jgi:hypothetical protein
MHLDSLSADEYAALAHRFSFLDIVLSYKDSLQHLAQTILDRSRGLRAGPKSALNYF